MAWRMLLDGRKVIHCIDGERLLGVFCGLLYRISRFHTKALLYITTNETNLQQVTGKACNDEHVHQRVS